MFKIKKAVKLLALVLTLLLSTSLFASNVNCSTTSPDHNTNASGGISILGVSPPSAAVNLNNGAMRFSGTAEVSTLYTDNYFTGKSTVSYNISNYSKYQLTVKLYKQGSSFAVSTTTISSGATVTSAFSGLSASSNYYLSFSAPSNFSGSVY